MRTLCPSGEAKLPGKLDYRRTRVMHDARDWHVVQRCAPFSVGVRYCLMMVSLATSVVCDARC